MSHALHALLPTGFNVCLRLSCKGVHKASKEEGGWPQAIILVMQSPQLGWLDGSVGPCTVTVRHLLVSRRARLPRSPALSSDILPNVPCHVRYHSAWLSSSNKSYHPLLKSIFVLMLANSMLRLSNHTNRSKVPCCSVRHDCAVLN
jgi:hypothetical protein